MKGKLYLIPLHLGGTEVDRVAVPQARDITQNLRHFIVENVRASRRYMSQLKHPDINSSEFFELNKHTDRAQLPSYLAPIKEGLDIGLMSEAGCPGVADPGAEVVRLAHEQGIQVVPLVGANSMLLALMASGLSGQEYAFHGYLPKDRKQRIDMIRNLESRKGSQIFMEAPFRNNHMLDDLLSNCKPDSLLCIGSMLTTEDEFIQTKSIADWKNRKPDLHKKPTVFIIGR